MNNKGVKIAIQAVLVVLVVFLGYKIYDGIMTPINFNKEKDIRYNATIERLKDIRTIQVSYKDVYGEYANNFDKLIAFVSDGDFPSVVKVGTTPESLIDSLGIEQAEIVARELGLIKRDTVPIPVLDSLFSEDYNVDIIRYVPFTDKKEQFVIKSGEVKTASQVKVKVFEATVLNNVLLHGMDKQLLINLNDEKEQLGRFPGLKVGDIAQANNNQGNWE